MPTAKRQQKNLSVTGCLWSIVLIALIVVALSWNGQQQPLVSDADMISQWQREKSQWTTLIETCQQTQKTYDLLERYQKIDKLISLGSLQGFTGCEKAAIEGANTFQDVAQRDETALLVLDRRRKGTGWIEEKASQWSGGWVSWKSAILEEKGYLYLTQAALVNLVSALPTSAEITTEPLDQFVGQYRGTSQISGNSSCELWKLRPLASEVDDAALQSAWYLFYHQARECPS